MNVTETTATIELSRNDIWTLVTLFQDDLLRRIREHYNCLQQNKDGESLFYESEKERLRWTETLYGLHGYSDGYKSVIARITRLFVEKRTERAKEDGKDE